MTATLAREPAPGGPPPPPPTTPPRDRLKLRRRLTGVAFLVVLALLAWLSIAAYDKDFTPAAMVTLYTDSAGSEMHVGSMVMVRGVQVGEVRQITATGHGARLLLALQPGELKRIPANVAAEMLPTTLFGERYVDLIVPARPSVRTLASGGVIGQNRSHDALELENVLNNTLPVLTASEPDKLSLFLTGLAQGLQGHGKTLGQLLVTLNADLSRFNPNLPALDTDIARLVQFTRDYQRSLPQVLQALNDFAVVNQTISSERANYAALLANVTAFANDIHGFLNANSVNVIKLGVDSKTSLRILAAYAPEFPCTLRDLANFVPNADRILGRGTRQPGLHVQVDIVPSLGRYLPRKDTPVYGDNLGPHCYPIPFPGIHLNDGTGPPNRAGAAPSTPATTRAATGPAWLAGSPPEAELVRELASLSLHRSPASLPGWSSLLVAPLYRGTQVVLGVNRA